MCNPTSAILSIAKALHARHEARQRLRARARPQETDTLTDPAARRPLRLDADAPISTTGALALGAAKVPDPPSVGQERGWEWSVQAQGWASASAGREMVVQHAHALAALSVPLHRDVGRRDPWPSLYASDSLDRLAVSGRDMALRDDGVADVGRIADKRLRVSDRRREGRSRGRGEEGFERRMGRLRICDRGRERGAGDWGEEDFGRSMGALRVSDHGGYGRVWGGGEEDFEARMRGLRISDVRREQVPQRGEEDEVEKRMRRMKIF